MWKLNGKKSSAVAKSRAQQMRLEKQAVTAFPSAFDLVVSGNPPSPLLLSSPHSGRLYPQGFLGQTRLSADQLRLPEDCFVDQIIMPLGKYGIPVLQALFPRCYVDVNRSADELPPERPGKARAGFARPTSARAHAGLGVIPTHIRQGMEIYARPLTDKQIQSRLDTLYHPYHNALNKLIESTKIKFGHVLLLDCHSMPGNVLAGHNRADFVLGDGFGETCHPATIDFLHAALEAQGYRVTRNNPYAGGYITRHYGRPDQSVEAIQIEINKDLYLDQDSLDVHAGMTRLMNDLQITILSLSNYLCDSEDIAAQ